MPIIRVMKLRERGTTSMVIVGAALLLLPILAILQYRWLAQLSDREREHMKLNMRATATRFSQDFDDELTRAYAAFTPTFELGKEEGLSDYAARYDRWLSVAQYPRLVKEVLVAYGFRLPSALDNRPLNFEEWEQRVGQRLFVSATPGPYELRQSGGAVVEQIIRPTGLLDPVIEVRPVRGQVDDLLGEIRDRAAKRERVLVTTLTKRMAEDLTQYYQELAVKVRYLHSDIDTLERIQILRDLRRGEFDVLVGINLLREGLDLPEVSLVAILDADKEGFLRSGGSLIQTVGRAARNVNGKAIMYADAVTDSMRQAIDETERRRAIQEAYNREHGITPASIVKSIDEVLTSVYERDYVTVAAEAGEEFRTHGELEAHISELQKQMKAAAANLEFEKAAGLRDRIKQLRSRELGLAGSRR